VRYRARVPTSTAKNGTSTASAANTASTTSTASPASPASPAKAGRNQLAKDKVDEKQPISVLFDRVMVQISPTDGERRSRAGILIPATAQITRRLTWAEAVAVGPHVRTVKVGDTVLFNPEDRFEVEVHGEEYVILRERDIHAIASPRNDSGTGLYL
jgi:chaperonin GroES